MIVDSLSRERETPTLGGRPCSPLEGGGFAVELGKHLLQLSGMLITADDRENDLYQIGKRDEDKANDYSTIIAALPADKVWYRAIASKLPQTVQWSFGRLYCLLQPCIQSSQSI